MEALAEDIEDRGEIQKVGQVKSQTKTQVEMDESVDTADQSMISSVSKDVSADKSEDPVADLTRELKEKFNIDALREEKEAEIQTYVVQLDQFKQEIENSQARA